MATVAGGLPHPHPPCAGRSKMIEYVPKVRRKVRWPCDDACTFRAESCMHTQPSSPPPHHLPSLISSKPRLCGRHGAGLVPTNAFSPPAHPAPFPLPHRRISQASAAQRAGRSGRLMPGRVFRLYSSRFHDGVMPRYDTPEMLRLSLDAVCLKVRRHCLLVRDHLSVNLQYSSLQVKLLGIRTGDAPLEARKPGSPPAAVASSAKAILAMSIQVWGE